MNKLELKHLAPYLPWDIKVRCDKPTYKQRSKDRIGIIDHWYKDTTEVSVVTDRGYYLCEIEYIKLILHPLSDLTKPITVEGYNEGKEFVPIVELAKVAYPKSGMWEYKEDFLRVFIGHDYLFFYNQFENSFSCQKGYNGSKWDYDCFVNNQLQLFQLLYQWHFAIDIPEGTWIDINTLK